MNKWEGSFENWRRFLFISFQITKTSLSFSKCVMVWEILDIEVALPTVLQQRYLISCSSHGFWNSPCWEVSTCQGGFKWILKDQLVFKGNLHLIFISIKGLMQWGGDILLMTSNKFLKISSLLDFCLFDCCHLSSRLRIQWRRWDSTS